MVTLPGPLTAAPVRRATGRLLQRRGVARVALAALTVGVSALTLVALQANSECAATTVRLEEQERIDRRWEEVVQAVSTEYEALMDHLATAWEADALDPPVPDSARSALNWLAHSDDAETRSRAVAVEAAYRDHTARLRAVLAAIDVAPPGADPRRMRAVTLAVSRATVAVREIAVEAADRHRELADAELVRVRHADELRRAQMIALGSADAALALLCGLLLFGYQRRAERDAAASSFRAGHDDLTGLANRRLLGEQLTAAVAAAEQEEGQVALLLLDLDRFKEVNDTLGHQEGDRLLQELARRLREETVDGEVVARLGGDEFALLIPTVADAAEAEARARRLLSRLVLPVTLGGLTVEIGCSIGIAVHPQHGREPVDLFKSADIAMYAAKRSQVGVGLYSGQAMPSVGDQLGLLAELRRAMECDELVLHYQPKVSPGSGAVLGVEALLRWQHPERGLLGPDQFLPAAERSELILPLTHSVISMALAQIRAWVDTGRWIPISVNVDVSSLLDPEFAERVGDCLTISGAPAELLTLEITERALMSHSGAVLTALERLRELGVRLALDDFGVGYSSLGYLERMGLDEIKVDRRFVTGMLASDQDRAITRAVIEIAHSLGLRVVCEGVEDAATLAELHDLRCDEAQGYFMCRPVPATELESWLVGNQAAVVAEPATVVRAGVE